MILPLLLIALNSVAQKRQTENIIFISVDGYRWEELFRGMDTSIFNKRQYRKADSAALMQKYWAGTPGERRSKLMPFFWSTLVSKGQLYGNRDLGNEVNVRNNYWFSYPGRAETITGYFDPKINSNGYPDNPNTNVFEFIEKQKGYRGKVATFASWGAVSRIVNRNRNKMPLINPYEKVEGPGLTEAQQLANELQDYIPKFEGEEERWDMNTYAIARTYILARHPRMVYLDFGDLDVLAHEGRYDFYLEAARATDQMIGSLWNALQQDAFYRNKTTFVICPDHGRGGGRSWTGHGASAAGSGNTWLAVIGPDTPATGEVKTSTRIYQDQFAQTMAHLLGFEFKAEHPVGERVTTVTGR
ncbi:phosphoglycerate mutase [Niabella drilacis]|uniref:Phosphoglycerate mutase n=2 Tax=Niabella drilacis (strain DSM 25811 / CCM 8410 / CCUG 62505 / LMG 26954 / E90) TaxID=1285928 RepID=A0A1G6R9J7_NIADE|nr:phosphoglycerate mutase [Niabella drilacis]